MNKRNRDTKAKEPKCLGSRDQPTISNSTLNKLKEFLNPQVLSGVLCDILHASFIVQLNDIYLMKKHASEYEQSVHSQQSTSRKFNVFVAFLEGKMSSLCVNCNNV